MKKLLMLLIVCALVLPFAFGGGKSEKKSGDQTVVPGTVNLKDAVGEFTAYIVGRLPGGTLTAVVITDAPVQRLGNYVADELTGSLLDIGGLRMVSRQDFERVVAEQNLHASGYIDDKTAAGMGHILGWRTIIYGAVEPLADSYRLSLRAVDVENGELRGSKSYMLNGSDPVLINLVNPNISVQRLTEREKLLQPFDGKHNDFNINVSVNKTVYYDNEELFITLRSNENCYFVVYHLDIDNNMQVIYPNFWEKDGNILKAGVARVIPEDTSFALHAPYGEERILVYASLRRFDIPEDQYSPRPVTGDLLASPQALWRIEAAPAGGSKALTVTPRGATAQISYTILPGR
jgi:hypothetical protein